MVDYYNIGMALLCVGFSAVCCGVNLGLLSTDDLHLKIKMLSGDKDEAIAAKRLLPLMKDHHRLLVTLLLCNSLAAEALPLFLDDLVDPLMAVIISVTCVLIFAEILPAAIFTGAGQLTNSAKLAPFVEFLLTITYPIAMPIGLILDKMFPHEHDDDGVAKREELEALMILHAQGQLEDSNNALDGNNDQDEEQGGLGIGMEGGDHQRVTEGGLDTKETKIITGVLRLHRHSIKSVMTSFEDVDCLSGDTEINEVTLHSILKNGHSRLPIYRGDNPNNICGILITKYLITVKADDHKKIGDLKLQKPLFASPNVSLLDMMTMFTESYSHLALITSDEVAANEALERKEAPPTHAKFLGLVTFEDILERMIGEDIYDEYDQGLVGERLHLNSHADSFQDINPKLARSISERTTSQSSSKFRNSQEETPLLAKNTNNNNSGGNNGLALRTKLSTNFNRLQSTHNQKSYASHASLGFGSLASTPQTKTKTSYFNDDDDVLETAAPMMIKRMGSKKIYDKDGKRIPREFQAPTVEY